MRFREFPGFAAIIYSHMGTPAMVMRIIGLKIRTLEELKLPPVLRDITLSLRGMTLVTGTTGSGKSNDAGRDGRSDQ